MTIEPSAAERMRSEVTDWDGGFPDYWDPKPGDALIGTLERYDVGTTKLGERQIAIVRDEESGELISVWLSRSVLKNEFERQAPQPGDLIGLKYFGLQQPRDPNGSEFHKYGLRVSRAPGSRLMVQTSAETAAPAPAASTSPNESDDLPF